MSEEDKTRPLPVRDGIATGRANERQMANEVPPGGFHTALRNNADGSQTMLRTRGGALEYTTRPAKLPADGEKKCNWTYDFYPVKRDENDVLVSDTTEVSSYVGGPLDTRVPNGYSASKVRRKGVKVNSDGTATLPAMESEQERLLLRDDPADSGTKMGGCGYWYNANHSATWTPYTRRSTTGMSKGYVWPRARFDNKATIQVGLDGYFITSSGYVINEVIIAACVVKSQDGSIFYRVATARQGGDIQGGINVVDVLKGTDTQLASKFNTEYVTPVNVGGRLIFAIDSSEAMWSPDGKSLIVPAFFAGAATAYASALVLDVTRPNPNEGSAVISARLYSPPVTDYRPDPVVTHEESSVTSVDTNNNGLGYDPVAFYSSLVEITPAPPNFPLQRYYQHDDRSLYRTVSVGGPTIAIVKVGFTKENVPCAVVKRMDMITTVDSSYWYTEKIEQNYSGIEEWYQDLGDGWILGYRAVVTRDEISFRYREWVSRSSRLYRGTLSWCEGDSLVYSSTKEKEISDTALTLTPDPIWNYHGVAVLQSNHNIVVTESDTSYYPIPPYSNVSKQFTAFDYVALFADAYDKVMVTQQHGGVVWGTIDRTEDYYHPVETGTAPETWHDYPQEFEIWRKGALLSTHAAEDMPLVPSRRGETAWCPYEKSMLMFICMTLGGTETFFGGRFYRGGHWRVLVNDPSEPALFPNTLPYNILYSANINPLG